VSEMAQHEGDEPQTRIWQYFEEHYVYNISSHPCLFGRGI